MRLPFGIEISRRKAAPPPGARAVDGEGRGWLSLWNSGNWSSDGDREMGSWQRDERSSDDSIFAQATVFSCMTLIAGDWSKLNLRAVQRYGRVWLEKTTPGITDLLEQPNHFQTRQQFIESWALSKLSRGNAYILKVRDRARERPKALIVLNPDLVTPLVAPNGDVYYQLGADDLAGVTESTFAVPASEIIHDRWNCLFHPLVGLSPIFASGLAATQSLRIQQNSAKFFRNMARPGGMLTAPAKISDETAKRLKKAFEDNFKDENIGRLFVGGDGLTYTALSVNAVDSQVVEQLNWSAKTVAATFHVPPYMVGAAEPPALNNIEAEQQRYYNQCLQALIEGAEACLDRGLGLMEPIDGNTIRTDFNVEDLLRMDSQARIAFLEKAAGIMKVDEQRSALNLLPTEGGDAVYLQQQNFSLPALAKRDAGPDPFGASKPTPAPPAPAPAAQTGDEAKAFAAAAREQLEESGRAVVSEVRDQAAIALKSAGEEAGRAVQEAADAAAQQIGAVEKSAAAAVAQAVDAAADSAGAAIAAAGSKAMDALAGGQQAAVEQHLAAARDAAEALKAATNTAAEQLSAAAGRAAEVLMAERDAAAQGANAATLAADAAAAETRDRTAAEAKEHAMQLRAAGDAARAAIEQMAQQAVGSIVEQAQAALVPLMASFTQAAAAAKRADADDEDDFDDLASRIALALETSDA